MIDNRQQALSLTYEGGPGGHDIAIGRTIYTYDEGGAALDKLDRAGRWAGRLRAALLAPVLAGRRADRGAGRPVATTGGERPRLSADLRPREGGETPTGPGGCGATGRAPGRGGGVGGRGARATRCSSPSAWSWPSAPRPRGIEITSDFSDFGTEAQIEAPEVASPTPAAARAMAAHAGRPVMGER